MRHILKQLKKVAHEVRLTTDEKSAMRATLVRFAAAHPSANPVVASTGIPSPYILFRKMRNLKTMALFSVGGLVLSSGVAFAAEGALPGDVLYPIKTEVNERVRGMAAITPRAKAALEVRLVERRLEEIEKINKRHNMPPEVEEVAQKNLEKYTRRVEERAAKFEEKEDHEGADEVKKRFDEMLRSHEDVAGELHRRRAMPRVIPAATPSTSMSLEEPIPYLQETVEEGGRDDEKEQFTSQKNERNENMEAEKVDEDVEEKAEDDAKEDEEQE